MNKYDRMLKSWGLGKLAEAGFDVSDASKVYVDFTQEWSGGCETCGWDMNLIVIAYRGRSSFSVSYEAYEIDSLLAEVMEYAVVNNS